LWYSPLMQCLLQFLKHSQVTVTGTVRIKLHKGHAIITGRKSPYSLYDIDLATYKANDQFNHAAAKGFIEIYGLPYRVHSKISSSLKN
jgi:argininosuccinate synthase